MTTAVLVLTTAYVGVAALLLHLSLATPYARWIKTAAISGVTLLYGFSWHGSLGLLGWPTPDPPPDAFRLYGVFIEEPDSAGSREGGIYFWVRSLDEAGNPVGEPRAHAMPWSLEFAQASQSAQEELAEGALIEGHFTEEEAEDIDSEAEGDGGSDTDGALQTEPQEQRAQFEFRRVTRPELPPKPPPDGAQG